MIVNTSYENVPGPCGSLRTFVAEPKAEGTYPGILCYSDIFQLSGPMLRACVRLAGYGFVAAAPEIYGRIEPAGTVIPFDDAGRTRGMEDAGKTPVAHFDEDGRSVLDWLGRHPRVAKGKLGTSRFERQCSQTFGRQCASMGQGFTTESWGAMRMRVRLGV
jgi:carboxymethylenebutenolidase